MRLVVLFACASVLACSAQPGAAVQPIEADDGRGPAPDVSSGEAFVSRSAGESGSLVVFWPRVIPRSDDPEIRALAGEVQAKLVEIAHEAFPERPLDVRPEPERVCPRTGCEGSTFGALLVNDDSGCAAVALFAEPGTAPTELVVWAGDLVLENESAVFREPPEDEVGVRGTVPCNTLVQAMTERDDEIVEALRTKAR